MTLKAMAAGQATAAGRSAPMSDAASAGLAGALGIGGLVAACLDGNAQLGFAAIAILLVGVPHGASDHLVVLKGRAVSRRGFGAFLALYGAAIAGVLLVWHLSAQAALAGFLALSAFHFAAGAPPSRQGDRRRGAMTVSIGGGD